MATKHASYTDNIVGPYSEADKRITALNVRCPLCAANPGERCSDTIGGSKEPHRVRKVEASEAHRKDFSLGWSYRRGGTDRASGNAGFYDERYRLGRGLAIIGAGFWVLAAIVYFTQVTGHDDDPFAEVAEAATGFIWGGIIAAFGCFVMLCGVILIAGAERIEP